MANKLPSNENAEGALICTAILYSGDAAALAELVEPEDFYNPIHAAIWRAIRELAFVDAPIDIASLADHLEKHEPDNRPWLAILGEFAENSDTAPTPARAQYHGELIKEAAIRRRAVAAAAELARAAYDPKAQLSELAAKAQGLQATVTKPVNGPALKLLTADEILTTNWPEPVWAIPGLLPAGLTILPGKPKVGKSWLALQIAQAVAAGGVALSVRVEKGPVLYLALEDTGARLKERMQKQGWPVGLPAEFMPLGVFEPQVGDLRNGGGEKLARQIEARGYRLVVLDTLSRSLNGANVDQLDVADMTAALTPVQEMAHAHNCAVIMVDHHKKSLGTNPDAIADILGSTAKGAMADCIWGLYRESGKVGAKLAVTGRDIKERTLALRMDWELGCWQCEGDADELALTEARQEVLDALKALGGEATTQELAEHTGKDKGNVSHTLADLVNGRMVIRGERRGREVPYHLIDDNNNDDDDER
jgi:DNA-binding transcriptional ArsR family regulator/Mrp family chromosome partitioning ATPase